MEQYNEIVQIISLTLGVAWASGINLYAAIFVMGLSGNTGYIDLPENLLILTDPLVIGAAGFMYLIEFVVDKIPGLDTGWDTFHTFICIPAGVVLSAKAVGDVNTPLLLAAGIVGGGVTAGTHATKAGSRALINTSPEPFTNWAASISKDVTVFAGLWAALQYPLLFLGLFICFILLAIWLLPKIWKGIKTIFGGLMRILGRRSDDSISV